MRRPPGGTGASTPVSRASVTPEQLLGPADLRAVLRVLQHAQRADDLTSFRMATLEGLARHLGYRYSVSFIGTSLENTLADRSALTFGVPNSNLAFSDAYRRLEALSSPTTLRLLRERGGACLGDLVTSNRPDVARRLRLFLSAQGFHSVVVIYLLGRPNIASLVSLFSRDVEGFAARDRALVAVLGKHLSGTLRLHASREHAPLITPKLTARESEVVRLLAEGMTNREIAASLSLSVDTVKHHITNSLVATGCSNRTQLALAWQRESGSRPAP